MVYFSKQCIFPHRALSRNQEVAHVNSTNTSHWTKMSGPQWVSGSFLLISRVGLTMYNSALTTTHLSMGCSLWLTDHVYSSTFFLPWLCPFNILLAGIYLISHLLFKNLLFLQNISSLFIKFCHEFNSTVDN